MAMVFESPVRNVIADFPSFVPVSAVIQQLVDSIRMPPVLMVNAVILTIVDF